MTDLTVLVEQLIALHATAAAPTTDSAAQTKLSWATRVLGDATTRQSEALTLAKQLFLAVERPPSLKSKGTEWQAEFNKLLSEYTYADLSGCIHWVFDVDDYWVLREMAAPEHLLYITGKLDGLMQRFRGWRKAERNRAAAKAEELEDPQTRRLRDISRQRETWGNAYDPNLVTREQKTMWCNAPDETEIDEE